MCIYCFVCIQYGTIWHVIFFCCEHALEKRHIDALLKIRDYGYFLNKMLPELRTTFFSGWSTQVSEVYPLLGKYSLSLLMYNHSCFTQITCIFLLHMLSLPSNKMFGVDLSRPPGSLWSRIPSCFTRMNHDKRHEFVRSQNNKTYPFIDSQLMILVSLPVVFLRFPI